MTEDGSGRLFPAVLAADNESPTEADGADGRAAEDGSADALVKAPIGCDD